jgi:hypothetical protein
MDDLRGNPISTHSSAAADAAERALWRMMSFYGTPIDDLDAAEQADPAWPLPALMKAGFLLSLTEASLLDDARALLARAQALLGAGQAQARERGHLHALQTLAAGDWHGARRAWEALLLQHPCDALALQWAHLFDFYQGDALNLRQRVARVLPQWDASDPLHPYVLGLHAFGLEECNLYAHAEHTGRRALAGAAKVPWAIHAVAHVMEMQGRHEEGLAWMARWRPDWTQGNGFVGHLGWHQALFALESLDTTTALDLFDEHLRADPAQITLQRLDAAAMLWRLHLLGADVGARWQALLAGWGLTEHHLGHYAFNDLHALLALVGAQDMAGARRWVLALAERAQTLTGANRETTREVGLPLMQGVLAFAEGQCDEAIALLYPVRAQASRLGGSHAQRDLIDQTLLAAASAAQDRAVGRALLNERRLAKPITPLTEHWVQRLARHKG